MSSEESLDVDLFHTWGTIQQYGWMIQFVFGDDTPPWAYTIGLAGGFDHPELALVGNWDPGILNLIGEQVRQGRRFADGDLVVVGPDECARLVEVHRDNFETSLFAMWLHYYHSLGPPYPEEWALEVVMPGCTPRLDRVVPLTENGRIRLEDDGSAGP